MAEVAVEGLRVELDSGHQPGWRAARRGRDWRRSGCWRPSMICAVISALGPMRIPVRVMRSGAAEVRAWPVVIET